jgi:hypothetical protein
MYSNLVAQAVSPAARQAEGLSHEAALSRYLRDRTLAVLAFGPDVVREVARDGSERPADPLQTRLGTLSGPVFLEAVEVFAVQLWLGGANGHLTDGHHHPLMLSQGQRLQRPQQPILINRFQGPGHDPIIADAGPLFQRSTLKCGAAAFGGISAIKAPVAVSAQYFKPYPYLNSGS